MAETRNKEYVQAATKEYVRAANMTGRKPMSVATPTYWQTCTHTVDERPCKRP